DFLDKNREALIRPVPDKAVPFSTPRAWTSLARALDLVEARKLLTPEIRLALAGGRVNSEDAEAFCLFVERRRLAEISLAGRLPRALVAKLREHSIKTAAQLLQETAPILESAGSVEKPAAGPLKGLRLF